MDGQVDDLYRGLVMREHLAVLHSLADHTVQRLDGIGGVDLLADVIRIIKQRNQVRPVTMPALADDRVFLVPDCSKGRQFLFGTAGSWSADKQY